MHRTLLLAPLLAILLAGCSLSYRPDMQQGNALSEPALQKLNLQMTRKQVRLLLGTPLVADPFVENRWDYYFSQRKGRGEAQNQRVTLIFTGDSLTRVEGDNVPAHLRPAPAPGGR